MELDLAAHSDADEWRLKVGTFLREVTGLSPQVLEARLNRDVETAIVETVPDAQYTDLHDRIRTLLKTVTRTTRQKRKQAKAEAEPEPEPEPEPVPEPESEPNLPPPAPTPAVQEQDQISGHETDANVLLDKNSARSEGADDGSQLFAHLGQTSDNDTDDKKRRDAERKSEKTVDEASGWPGDITTLPKGGRNVPDSTRVACEGPLMKLCSMQQADEMNWDEIITLVRREPHIQELELERRKNIKFVWYMFRHLFVLPTFNRLLDLYEALKVALESMRRGDEMETDDSAPAIVRDALHHISEGIQHDKDEIYHEFFYFLNTSKIYTEYTDIVEILKSNTSIKSRKDMVEYMNKKGIPIDQEIPQKRSETYTLDLLAGHRKKARDRVKRLITAGSVIKVLQESFGPGILMLLPNKCRSIIRDCPSEMVQTIAVELIRFAPHARVIITQITDNLLVPLMAGTAVTATCTRLKDILKDDPSNPRLDWFKDMDNMSWQSMTQSYSSNFGDP